MTKKNTPTLISLPVIIIVYDNKYIVYVDDMKTNDNTFFCHPRNRNENSIQTLVGTQSWKRNPVQL